DVTVLLVELRPVDNELRPVEVDVDSDVIALLVELKPVDSEPIPVDVEVDNDVMLDNVDVDSEVTAWFVASSCEPLIASVLVG
ncbi:hypothetical protein, partial [Burkholderia ambifaria]|uniref:hypothetical protein n=1 Tax=Burkholderia ambifaria TaxID=152480 RepID=UPI002445ED86